MRVRGGLGLIPRRAAGATEIWSRRWTAAEVTARIMADHRPYHAAVEAARQMSDGGRIIVIGSTNGDRMPFAGGAAYALTKSAMQGMVRGLARDFGTRGITVNSIQPGPTDSDMNPADGPMADFMHSFMAIPRHIHASEVAELAAYLAGPHAAMITGSLQTIDGGFGA